MVRIAIVEDDVDYRGQLSAYLERYSEEKKEKLNIKTFHDGDAIVSGYKPDFDIIFMDIQMKIMDGMKAAQCIREMDENVIIIFITNMAQYAIQGYSVNAINFILKPVSYLTFSEELSKAIRRLKERVKASLIIKKKEGLVRLDISHITYIESQGHKILIHSDQGVIETIETMKNLELQLLKYKFYRCNNCYLVNLRFVESIQHNIVTVAGETLQISRPRKKAFMEALTDYMGDEMI